jgi:replication factor A1
VLQCLGAKEIPGSGSKRVRLMLSDGVHTMATCMLASQLNHLVTEGKLQTNAIMRLNKFSSSILQDGTKRVVICLDIDVMFSANEVGKRIGEPVSVSQAAVAPLKEQNRAPMSNMQSPKPKKHIPKPPSTPGGSETKVMPIDSLTPYQNRRTIKARVVNKGTMREWKNARGEGKLFSFTVMDDSCDIRLTCFNEEATKFNDMLILDKVYYISNGSLKPANPQYNNTKHDYEMTVRRDTVIEQCDDNASQSVAKANYSFVSIKDLPQHVNKVVDVIGVVKEVGDLSTVMIKSRNKEAQVRNIVLVDQSSTEVRATLWIDQQEQYS